TTGSPCWNSRDSARPTRWRTSGPTASIRSPPTPRPARPDSPRAPDAAAPSLTSVRPDFGGAPAVPVPTPMTSTSERQLSPSQEFKGTSDAHLCPCAAGYAGSAMDEVDEAQFAAAVAAGAAIDRP